MNEAFWAALGSVLIAFASVLTAVAQKVRSQKVQARMSAENILERERKEAAERERRAAQEALEFRERLRQEAIAERGALVEQLADIAVALRENTNVMERSAELADRSINLTERILDGLIARGPRQGTTTTAATPRPTPRKSPRVSEGSPKRRTRVGKGGGDST